MSKFSPERFKEVAFLPENGLMDRKSQLYRVYGRNILKSRADLIKDMIALANTARRRGKPAYLFFGVQDKPFSGAGDPLPGIDGQYSRPTKPQDWDTLTIEEQQERVGRDYQKIIADYVTPPMDFEYLWGYVDGKLVSYILIEYNPHEHPFEVKKKVASKKRSTSNKGIAGNG
ncbi:MAG: RNA-binding domain-containing protein [Anaerolineae bacterium]